MLFRSNRHDFLERGTIVTVAGKHFIAQRQAAAGDHQADAHLGESPDAPLRPTALNTRPHAAADHVPYDTTRPTPRTRGASHPCHESTAEQTCPYATDRILTAKHQGLHYTVISAADIQPPAIPKRLVAKTMPKILRKIPTTTVAGEVGLTLVSADQELNAAAAVEAFSVEDPNRYP